MRLSPLLLCAVAVESFVVAPRRPFLASRWMSEESSAPEAADEPIEDEPIEDEAPIEEPAEDPALTKLKQEIADLESSLKAKRRELASVSDRAEEYTQTGYARKVAEMENMRRARSMLQSSNKAGATAAVITSFLPVVDELDRLRATYGEHEFGSKYNALPGAVRTAFSALGVTEYGAVEGDLVDASRITVVETVENEAPAGTILEALGYGLELQGNVIRTAECVASAGPPPAEVEDEVEEEAEAAVGQEESAQE